jgi:hypothetical protein
MDTEKPDYSEQQLLKQQCYMLDSLIYSDAFIKAALYDHSKGHLYTITKESEDKTNSALVFVKCLTGQCEGANIQRGFLIPTSAERWLAMPKRSPEERQTPNLSPWAYQSKFPWRADHA